MCSIVVGVLAFGFCIGAIFNETYIRALAWALLVGICAAGAGII